MATPASSWFFADWKGDLSSLNPDASLAIDGNKIVTATFVQLASCSMSINNGALYTARRQVQLFSDIDGAAEILLSNDAGFAGAMWQPYQKILDWTLSDPGERIVTLLVHARVRDSANNPPCAGLSLVDDIVYDPLPPTVAVTVTTQTSMAMAGADLQASNVTATLYISASDQVGGSSVAAMQIATSSNFTGASWQPFNAVAQISAQSGQAIHVRVRDGAGNVSATASAVVVGKSHRFYFPFIAVNHVSAPDLVVEQKQAGCASVRELMP
jgi:hypothetical protein